ncbi:transmembrane protein 163a-like isoform X1 [Acropora palmata]|uniref:transmembrane protein 163a-like isoform X1 n=2 Tax=Acropora palmata TaxID=6131 RepID=UPI003DA17B3D
MEFQENSTNQRLSEWIHHINVSRLFDFERQRQANRCAMREVVMFRERDKIDTDLSTAWRMAALLVSSMSLLITMSVGSAYFVFSTRDKSPAVFGFALSVCLDACSSAMVVWRFWGTSGQKYSLKKERTACIIIGGFLMLSGCAVLSKAVFMLIDDNERKRSTALLISTVATFVAMVILAWFKFLIAYNVDSRALRTNGFNSTVEAVIAFIMAISDLISQENPNVWFLDASASIFSAFVLFVYGARTVVELLLTKEPMFYPVWNPPEPFSL